MNKGDADLMVAGVEETEERVVLIPWEFIRFFKGQPRKDFREIDILAKGMALIGQILPVIVKRIYDDPKYPYELVDGERRWRACTKNNVKVRCIISDKKKLQTFDDQFLSSVVANFCRSDHTPMENAWAIDTIRKSERFEKLGATEQVQQLAIIFGQCELWIYNYHSLLKLDPEVQKKLSPDLPKDEAINLSVAFILARLPSELQTVLAKKAIDEKLSLDKVNFWARKIGAKMGIVVSGAKHPRRPSDDIRTVRNFISRSQGALDMFLDSLVLNQIRKGMPADLSFLAKSLEKCSKRINELAAAILVPGDSSASESPDQIISKTVKPPTNIGRKKRAGFPRIGKRQLFNSNEASSNRGGDSELGELVDEFENSDLVAVGGAPQNHSGLLRVRGNIVDDNCLGILDEVKSFTDVLTLSGLEGTHKRKELESREIQTARRRESIYVKYSESNGDSSEVLNKEGYFYGPFIVLVKFFQENKVSSDQDYLDKRMKIKYGKVKTFYPADIKNYRKTFQKWLERYLKEQKN
jgi:ParB/RepB/Spo0J family partition protein